MKVAALLLIAGNSSRFKSSTPKQMFLLKGKPVFEYALNTFVNNKTVDDVVVVVNKSIQKQMSKFASKKAQIVLGGKTRQESVANGLKALNYENNDLVIIHDGARPLIDNKIIKNVIAGAKKYGAVTTAITVEDTMAEVEKSNSIKTFVKREDLVRIQTPQAFKFGVIYDAHKKAKRLTATDDCSLVQNLNYKVKIIPGDKKLQKITTLEDIKILESLMQK